MKKETEFLYTRLANTLREQIHSGYIKSGDFIMTEADLSTHYGMSRTSVRKALDELLKEGLIVKRPGQGTMVSPDFTPKSAKRRTLTVFATSPSHYIHNGMQAIMDAFKNKHPDVDVKLLNIAALGFWESVRNSRELGIQPDLIFVTDREYSELENKDSFINLTEIQSDLPAPMYVKLAEAFDHAGSIIALPVTFSTVYLTYNPDLFRIYDVPLPGRRWTQKEFIKAARKLTVDTDGDGIIDRFGFSLSSALSRWPVIALQNGVNFMESGNREPLVHALHFLHEILYKQRAASLYQSTHYRLNSDAFRCEKAAMVLTTSIEIAGWRNEGLRFEPEVAPLPFGDLKSTLLVSNLFMIPSSCKDISLAADFLRTALDEQVQKKISAENQYLSVVKSVNEQVWDKAYLETLNIVNGVIRNGYFLHEVIPDAIVEELDTEMELFWAGMETADSFSERLHERIAAIRGTS